MDCLEYLIKSILIRNLWVGLIGFGIIITYLS